MKNLFPRMILASAMITLPSFLTLTGHAQTPDTFTDSQKKEIISVVRQAFKNDPTLLEDAIQTLQQTRQEQLRQKSEKTLVEKKNFLLRQQPTDGLIGDPNAKITITEFYDPRCPYCKKVLPELFQLVKENKDVKVILKAVPILGEDSVLQSQAILAAARQNHYVPMMKALMAAKENVTPTLIKTLAQQQKLNATQLTQDMEADSVKSALKDNIQLMRTLNIEGTPAFIINGTHLVPGAISYEDFKKIVQKLAK